MYVGTARICIPEQSIDDVGLQNQTGLNVNDVR